MEFYVLTLFPEMFDPFWNTSIIKRAIEKGLIFQSTKNIRDFAHDKHRVVDDKPYGGGSGMILKPEPLAEAIRWAKKKNQKAKTIYLSPQGVTFTQKKAENLASEEGLIFICGRYEGIDERIVKEFVDMEVSIGDYVLTGGELGAMVMIDSIARLKPGVLGNQISSENDSFSDGLLEYAQYTRPEVFEREMVPKVLLSGNHGEIEKWRLETSLKRTFLKRQDLLVKKNFTKEEIEILKKWCLEIERLITD